MMAQDRGSLVIVGASARAAAQSALRAGWKPWCVDLFADRDLQSVAPVVRCPADQYPDAIARIVCDQAPENAPLLYAGAMENNPEVLEALASDRIFLGCDVDTVRRARNPYVWQIIGADDIPGLQLCHISDGPSAEPIDGDWLVKPLRSAGGIGIHPWQSEAIASDCIIQEFVEGVCVGVVYFAEDEDVRILGVNRQIVGDAEFGSQEFRYVGSIGPLRLSQSQNDALEALGRRLMQHTLIKGIFGIDAVIDQRGLVRPLEINPRYTAGVEILERATNSTSLTGQTDIRGASLLHGKAVLFARQQVCVGDLYELFALEEIADVPEIGQSIEQDQPICTVFATGADVQQCLDGLYAAACRFYTHYRND